ncbi:MAG: response regulator [Gammaproteobacteria bacterium]|nr:response regulator [Gammaproteobacteria bacterium]
MPTSSNAATEKLLLLQQQFFQQLPEKLNAITTLWNGMKSRSGEEGLTTDSLHRHVHNLTGSGSTFGANSVSRAAFELEVVLQALSDFGKQDISSYTESVELQISTLLGELVSIASRWHPTEAPLLDYEEAEKEPIENNLIYIVEDDPLFGQQIQDCLEAEDYVVKHFGALDEFEQACHAQIPGAVIMDLVLEEGNNAGARAIEHLNQQFSEPPPVVVLSMRKDIEARLAAARAGVVRYFSKPTNMDALVGTMHGLTARVASSPYRILVVDDDEVLLEYYSTILRRAGMEVQTVSNPLASLDELDRFQPELILLDVFMPQCSGPELAQVIRQDDYYAHIPIVFLSTEANIDRQLAAMKLGGDDFITKPVSPKHLVDSVSARTKRARWMNRITRDLKSALRESEYQRITMDQHNVVCVMDESGLISSINEKLCKLSGFNREELIGRSLDMLYSEQYRLKYFQQMWDALKKGQIWRNVISHRHKNGDEYWLDTTIVPFLDDMGTPYQYVSTSTDVTELRRREISLKKAQQLGRIGNWSWDIDSKKMQWSDEMYSILGYALGEIEPSYDIFIERIHPDDLAMVKLSQGKSFSRGDNHSLDFRVTQRDGQIRWVHVETQLQKNQNGKISRLQGILQDISERKFSELKREGSTRVLEMISRDEPLTDILLTIIRHVEILLPGRIGAFLFLDEEGQRFNEILAPGMSDSFVALVAEVDIASGSCACGDTAMNNTTIVVDDILSDVRWNAYRDTAQKAGIRACCSVPVLLSSGKVLGTFALFSMRASEFTDQIVELAREMANFAAIALEQKQTQRIMLKAREAAERANHAKSEFLSKMSHELRTPLNAILGFSQLLQIEPLDLGQLNSVEEIHNAGNHLLELINDILDLSRIESGNMQFSLEHVAPVDVIQECVPLVKLLADKQNIVISTENKLTPKMRILVDPIRLRQALLNLLSNAVKYNRPGGEVKVLCRERDDGKIAISICDTGHGLSREKLAKLFTAFERLGAEKTDIEGTGIGLLITKNIAEMMGGEIEVESELGRGSAFSLIFSPDVNDTSNYFGDQETLILETTLSETNGVVNNGRKEFNVLYVEDNPSNLRLVATLLDRKPYITLYTAHTPEFGLELIAVKQFDLVLLDINLPGMDGFEVLRRIREDEKNRDITVFAVSANAMKIDVEKGLAAGFAKYLTKPIDIMPFYQAIDEALGVEVTV